MVKCTLVQALRLCTGRTGHRGSRVIALPFHYHGTRRGWGISITPRLLFTPGKDPAHIVQEAGWAPGPVWTGAENLAPTGILSPDRPARSQSLYRLRYPTHNSVKALGLLTYTLSLRDTQSSTHRRTNQEILQATGHTHSANLQFRSTFSYFQCYGNSRIKELRHE